jgi:HEAT repeat protein
MFSFKRVFILIVTALFVVSVAMGQTGREMTIEESYLLESIEMMIIRETSRAESMDQKLVALNFIGEAINRGNTGDDLRQTLEYLAVEGTASQVRENGRLVNNFPTVRREAARYLGLLGTEEAKDALLRVCIADNEPMVLQEAVKSLGDIGMDKNGDTISTITWIVRRFDVLNPDNLLALSAIEAFEKIAKKNNGLTDPSAVQLLIRISEGPYIRPVQDRAKQLISDLRNIR